MAEADPKSVKRIRASVRASLENQERFFDEHLDSLTEALERYPSIKIGSYPKWHEDRFTVNIVVESKDQELTQRAADHLRKVLS